MQLMIFMALAVGCVVGQIFNPPQEPKSLQVNPDLQEHQGLQNHQEQVRDKRTLLLQTYPTTLYNNLLYRDVIPSTYGSYYPYSYTYPNYYNYPYVYYK